MGWSADEGGLCLFFALLIVLFFTASAFFQAVLFTSDRGDRRHSFLAFLVTKTAAWQLLFHQGRRGSLRDD
jgi:hypothetical protein